MSIVITPRVPPADILHSPVMLYMVPMAERRFASRKYRRIPMARL